MKKQNLITGTRNGVEKHEKQNLITGTRYGVKKHEKTEVMLALNMVFTD